MIRAAALLTALALSACAPQPIVHNTPAPEPKGPEIVVRIGATGQDARTLVEHVAAGCWLDGVVRGAAMVVDRGSGRVVIDGDVQTLMAADFLSPAQDGASRLRLSGPVIGDPLKRDRLVETLDLAVRTGQTECPILQG